MNYDLNKIFDFDDRFFKEFSEICDRFVPLIKSSEYAVTGRTLLGLMGTANSIKLGIFDLAEECKTHLYVIKVLRRSLIEQYLRYYYILFRFLNKPSDDVGVEYRKYSRVSETLSFIDASIASKKIAGVSTDSQVLKKLKKDYPEFDISKKDLNDITYKWKHRSIIKYIKDNSSIIKDERAYLLRLIPEYAELSSFIHGGTFAEDFYHDVFGEKSLDEAVFNDVWEAAFMTASMKMHLLFMVSKIDDNFSEDVVSLSKLLHDFINDRA